MNCRGLVCGLFALALVTPLAKGERAPSAEQIRFFETSIRPLFADHCVKCHGPSKKKADLRLDTYEGLTRGGASGPMFVPGDPGHSLLLKAVGYRDEELRMPPKGKLTDRQIADLTRWVKMGAAVPRPAKLSGTADGADFWAFKPPVPQQPPRVKNASWPQTPVDRFVLARLEAAGLQPAPPADKRTLLRRAAFDLTGLSPTPAEIDSFLADDSPNAFARVVDRLLSSTAYGERWGRHWLDVARYADSNGLDENVAHGNAWRYRDYVIASFNRDKPYDQFLLEQMAGDLLPEAATATRHERLIATGFLSLGPKVLAEPDDKKMEMDIVDEQIDTLGRAVLGLTLGCARCHDHKFDPLPTEDYYALAGIFKSTRTMENFTKIARWHENSIASPAELARKAAFDVEVSRRQEIIKDVVARANAQLKEALGAGAAFPKNPETIYPSEKKAELKRLRDDLAALKKTAPEIPSAMGVSEGTVADTAILVRGNHLQPGRVVPRHFPTVLVGRNQPPLDPKQSGRLELARWLVRRDNPLTARVLINRVWRGHFGQGLVRSTDNFGHLGERPSHPELLDWLALRFVDDGWSLKKLHRLILRSSTYQMSDSHRNCFAEKDPDNRLLWRREPHRLEAEAVRDSLLAVSGMLDRTAGGPVLHVANRGYLFDHTSKDLTRYDSRRRSIYLPVIRNNVYDVFQLFDFVDPAVPTGDRATTTIAPQALFVLNSDLVHAAAEKLADVAWNSPGCLCDKLTNLYQRVYSRTPSDLEVHRAQLLLQAAYRSLAARETEGNQSARHAWTLLCETLLAANEFVYIR